MTILTGAYRLFFPSAALFAGLAIPLWLVAYTSSATRLPPEFGMVDKAALVLTVITALLWIATDTSRLTGIALATATAAVALRLSHWRYVHSPLPLRRVSS